MLKWHANSLVAPLTSIFHCSLREKVLPTVWKSANIISLAKTMPLMSVKTDIRPIYLTPIAAKAFESIIMNNVDDSVCECKVDRAFLLDRSQQVIIENTCSSSGSPNGGVAQVPCLARNVFIVH